MPAGGPIGRIDDPDMQLRVANEDVEKLRHDAPYDRGDRFTRIVGIIVGITVVMWIAIVVFGPKAALPPTY